MNMVKLTDGNITLREFSQKDKYRLVELANNREIFNNLRDAFPHPYTLQNAENFIDMCQKTKPPQLFAIEYDGLYVGNIGLHKETDVYRKSAEIGYFLGESYWNKGIMTKAVNLICEYGFSKLDIVRIHTGVFDYNIPSQKVLEKCGFCKEAVFKNAIYKNDTLCDEVRYSKLKSI